MWCGVSTYCLPWFEFPTGQWSCCILWAAVQSQCCPPLSPRTLQNKEGNQTVYTSLHGLETCYAHQGAYHFQIMLNKLQFLNKTLSVSVGFGVNLPHVFHLKAEDCSLAEHTHTHTQTHTHMHTQTHLLTHTHISQYLLTHTHHTHICAHAHI